MAIPGDEEVLNRLNALEEERLRAHRARTAKLRETLAEAFPDRPSVTLPYVLCTHHPHRIPVVVPVDERARFTADVPDAWSAQRPPTSGSWRRPRSRSSW